MADAEPPLIRPGFTLTSAAETIGDLVLRRPVTWPWILGMLGTSMLVALLLASILVLFVRGVGIWGIDIPVAWGFAIANFVWWIGIGHAGTLISAFLYLMRQRWRTSINRFAEAMTIFAVLCAAMFPLLHLGRPWYFYWMLPYPNHMWLWPQFRSPLIFDLFAVLTYLTVSVLFWYVGLIPDLANLRDRAPRRFQRYVYGVLAMGWRGSARHWRRYESLYLLLAGLATPLVISVHSIVSIDFAYAIVPSWHSTIYPPYFVAGAVYSGFAMVLLLTIPMRAAFGLQGLVTMRHLEIMAKLMLTTGLLVAYSYVMETFTIWYGGDRSEWIALVAQVTGTYWPLFWSVVACNVLSVQLLWFRRFRRSPLALFLVSLAVLFGMWVERVMIVVVGLHRDYLPSMWGDYVPTFWDWATLLGTVGFFLFLFLLFVRLLPAISISEVEKLVSETEGGAA